MKTNNSDILKFVWQLGNNPAAKFLIVTSIGVLLTTLALLVAFYISVL